MTQFLVPSMVAVGRITQQSYIAGERTKMPSKPSFISNGSKSKLHI
jgi:hypothetical protein